jgi:hypothetical protein
MKRLSAALALGLFFSVFCFAQTQTGDASYNASKTGFFISHSSLSFNTRVRVTNLNNSRSVEATVNGRIPITAERIADVSRDAGDALGMPSTGMTPVVIEILPFRQSAAEPVPETPAQASPVNSTGSAPEPAPRQPAAQPAAPVPTSPATVTQPLMVQTITEPQYIPVPTAYPAAPCFNTPLIIVVICLLLFAVALLVIILIVLLRRYPPWPWYYPVWFRRHYWYAKKRRT